VNNGNEYVKNHVSGDHRGGSNNEKYRKQGDRDAGNLSHL